MARFGIIDQWLKLNPIPIQAISAVRNMILRSVIVNLYRLKETRDGFLRDWLFTEEELTKLGFPPVELFFPTGRWKDFEMVRHQFAGHAIGSKATPARPARILSGRSLGNALKQTGLSDLPRFLKRIQAEVLPGVEKVRDILTNRYPDVKKFVTETYPLEIEAASFK